MEANMSKWSKGVPSEKDLPCQLVWGDSWNHCVQSVVLAESKGCYRWACLFAFDAGFIWYVYETSSSSHKVLGHGLAKTASKAKEAAQAPS
jgi:hypothetical protein